MLPAEGVGAGFGADENLHNKLFIGGLSAVTTNESLSQYFNTIGPAECQVMMDRVTGRSRGFGFVTFQSQEAVTAALATPHIVDGKVVECRHCLSKAETGPPLAQRQPDLQAGLSLGNFGLPPGGIPRGGSSRPLENKVFIGGLAPTTTTESLNHYFQRFGPSDCIVMMDRQTGRSRGFGFCTFSTAEQASVALAAGTQLAHGAVEHIIDGKVVSVKVCEAKVEGHPPPPPLGRLPGLPGLSAPSLPSAPVAMPGVAPGLDALQQTLGSLSALLQQPAACSQPPQGLFAQPDPSALALAATPGALQAPQPGPRGSNMGQFAANRIFVGGLPQTCDDSKLHIFFSQYGTLTDAKVMMDKETRRSRGFGYVSFASSSSMEAALGNHLGNVIDEKWVEVKRCESKGSPALQAKELASADRAIAAAAAHQAGAGAFGQLQPQAATPALPGALPGADPGALQAQLAGLMQLAATPNLDLVGQLTQALQDPQLLLQAVLNPVMSQLQGGGLDTQPAPAPQTFATMPVTFAATLPGTVPGVAADGGYGALLEGLDLSGLGAAGDLLNKLRYAPY